MQPDTAQTDHDYCATLTPYRSTGRGKAVLQAIGAAIFLGAMIYFLSGSGMLGAIALILLLKR